MICSVLFSRSLPAMGRGLALAGMVVAMSGCSLSSTGGGLETAMFATSGAAVSGHSVSEGGSVSIPLEQLLATAAVTVTESLPNDTFLPGDNSMTHLRLSNWGFGSPLSRALGQIGTLPAPFEYITERDFRPAGDVYGQYHYAVSAPDADTTCVLAIRVAEEAGRLKVMRNCVIGDLVEALEPILET